MKYSFNNIKRLGELFENLRKTEVAVNYCTFVFIYGDYG